MECQVKLQMGCEQICQQEFSKPSVWLAGSTLPANQKPGLKILANMDFTMDLDFTTGSSW